MARSTQDAETQTPETPEAEKVVKLTAKEAADQLPAADSLTPAQQFVQGSITRAASLIEAKHAIQADLQQSRDFLAFAAKGGDVTAEQTAWIAEYLPKRNRASGDATTEGE